MATIGAILTGGHSRRMGRTKALIEVDGVPMALRVADALVAGGCTQVVLVGGDADELSPLNIAVIADLHPGDGPLGGVLTAIGHAGSSDDVIVVACDLPHLRATAVAALVSAAAESPAADVVVAHTDRREPACALWRARAAPALQQAFDGGTRALHQVFGGLVIVDVDVDPGELVNVNRPGDVPGQ